MTEYVLSDAKWGTGNLGTTGGEVTWSFAEKSWGGFDFESVISAPAYQDLIREAFDSWEAVANIDFVESADVSTTDIRLGWEGIDGAYNVAGEARWSGVVTGLEKYSITSAEVRFDSDETWSTVKDYAGSAINFYSVALHEIGHALGLDHTSEMDTIMYPQVTAMTDLGAGDITGAQLLYGAATTEPAVPVNPDAVLSADATVGDDIFAATTGSDTIDGLDGLDTVVFEGTRAESDIDSSASTTVVTDDAGVHDLANVERLEFSDGTLAFDTDGDAGIAYRLYQAAFDRVPDAEGLGYWIQALDDGSTDAYSAASGFIGSNEFQATYGTAASVSDTGFIDLLYANVLNRAADTTGYEYWTAAMDAGDTRSDLLVAFSESSENHANVAAAISDGIWFA